MLLPLTLLPRLTLQSKPQLMMPQPNMLLLVL
jgi:hypothetical protein